MVRFGCAANRDEVHAVAQTVMSLRGHPDSGPDGLTELRAREAKSSAPGRAGFTHRELPPHTEGSSVACPPQLLMLVCLRPAEQDGHTLLVDGADVFADLAERAPETLRVLTRRGAAYFGGADGHAAPVFDRTNAGRWSVRLRLDDLVRFAPHVSPHLPRLEHTLERNTHVLDLAAGEGVLLDNTRWLHGRRGFVGERVMLRALGTCRADTPVSLGFFSSWAVPTDPPPQIPPEGSSGCRDG
ncbi:hypothetical protein EFW17_08795 [Halostreptopolyspora alba]|uniref:TauD/TfdA-like domain-containing protein n=2 Tax=Halostreptopolyspora alba TaxID=2487137 RepID=A0A3N0ECR0_9ACTN|nr:hypothetical protein EFW17_08795 [Nocardiopsaceae bacterium YIM 96095]